MGGRVRGYRLVVIGGASDGVSIDFTDSVTIGRTNESEFGLDDPAVSRQHARVRVAEGLLYLEDLGSTNGTEYEGVEIQLEKVSVGDVFTIGETVVRIERAAGVPPVASPRSARHTGRWIAGIVTVMLLLGVGFAVVRARGRRSPTPPAPPSVNEDVTKPSVATAEPLEDEDADKPPVAAVQPPEPAFELPPVPAYESVEKKVWNNDYRLPYGGWGWGSTPEDARKNHTYVAPVGIRGVAHVRERQDKSGFQAIAPRCLTDESGYLVANALEVLHVVPGSPAEGKLLVGDLILGVDGELLKSGREYRPDWEFHTKDRRNIKVQLGEAVDRAEGRGSMSFRVLRIPTGGELPRPGLQRTELAPKVLLSGKEREQAYDVDVSSVRELILRVGQGNENIHGDGARWVEPTFVMADGSERFATEDPWLRGSTGYGRLSVGATPEGKEMLSGGTIRTNTIYTHAISEIAYLVPDGATRFRTTAMRASHGVIDVSIDGVRGNLDEALPEATKRLLTDVKITLPRIGSFAKGYPANCRKTDWIVQQNVNWLLALQQENGSWPRWGGYTTDNFDTSIVGLALLATGDPDLRDSIRKAAHYVAYEGTADHWASPRATSLLFLSEYYLATRDSAILNGLEHAYRRLQDCVFFEGFAGHGDKNCGYGYGGVCLSAGHACAALAVASKCPFPQDSGALWASLYGVASLSVDGSLPYGRMHNKERQGFWPEGRRGGYAPTGPALIGTLIGGGSQRFVRDAREMYRNSLGLGDIAHSSQTIGWWGTAYGLPASDPETFYKHMEIFKHKIAMHRCWNGGFCASQFPFDYMGGEGVMGGIFRTACYLISLCAHREQIAITGNKALWAKNLSTREPSHNWHYFTYSYYLRNWAVADTILGAHSPAVLKQGVRTLDAMPQGEDHMERLFAFLDEEAPRVVDAIMSIDLPSERQRAYAVELVLGLDLRIDCAADENDALKQSVTLEVSWPFRENMRRATDEERKAYQAAQRFPVKGTAAIVADASVLSEPVSFAFDSTQKGTDWRGSTRKLSKKVQLRNGREDEFLVPMRVEYSVGRHRLSYVRNIPFNRSSADIGRNMMSGERRITVPCTIVRDCIGQEILIELPNGVQVGLMTPESRNIPMRLPGGRDWVKTRDVGRQQEGDKVMIEYVAYSIHVGVCMRMQMLSTGVKRVRPVGVSCAQATVTLPDGGGGSIHDGDLETVYEIARSDRGHTNLVLNLDLGLVQPIDGMGFWGSGAGRVQLHAEVDGEFRLLYSGRPDHSVRFPTLHTRYMRLGVTSKGNVKIKELALTHNTRKMPGDGWGWRK